MIFFKFRIENPWFTPTEGFESKDYYWKDVKLSENKNFEIQISRFERSHLMDVAVDLRWWGQDHAGPELDINILGYMFNMKIYDSRHWNYENNRWQTDAEAQAQEEEWLAASKKDKHS
jgi:hypothetical protein